MPPQLLRPLLIIIVVSDVGFIWLTWWFIGVSNPLFWVHGVLMMPAIGALAI